MQARNNRACPQWMKLLLLFLVVLPALLLTKCNAMEAKSSTMQKLFQTALEPMGSTMYVWGGGWDSKNESAAKSTTQIGVSKKWADFANKQDESYDFKEYRYESEKGLDCSGYIGWVMYNLFEDKDGREGYVTFSTEMAEDFAGRGWGRLIKNPKEFLPGDIVSMEGHVWMSLGTCADGSVLLMHSSPPGVSVCGTRVPGTSTGTEGDTEEAATSIAITLAEEFMTENYPDWQEKYPNRAVSELYLEGVRLMRWNERTLTDAIEFQSMSGEEVMEFLQTI